MKTSLAGQLQGLSSHANRVGFLSTAPRLEFVDPDQLQRITVSSLRVPFEGAVGVSYGGVARPESTLLYLISHAARVRQDFTVFDCLLVTAMLQFKWNAYAERIFRGQFISATVHLGTVSVFSYTGVRFLDDATGRGWNIGSGFGAAEVCIGLASLLGSVMFLIPEIRQLLVDGQRAYFDGVRRFCAHSVCVRRSLITPCFSALPGPWKYLDMSALCGQIVVVYLFAIRSSLMRPIAAWSPALCALAALPARLSYPTVLVHGPLGPCACATHTCSVYNVLLLGWSPVLYAPAALPVYPSCPSALVRGPLG